MFKKFQRRKEDFICEKCGANVYGNGYTNHCPKCLWSKHVDVMPGDRNEKCKGIMEPINIERNGDNFDIVFRCVKCKIERRTKSVEGDSFEKIIELSKQMGR